MINKRQKKGGKIFDFDKGEGLIVGLTLEERMRPKEEIKQEMPKEQEQWPTVEFLKLGDTITN